jgi:hypothetical protein
MLHMRVDSWAVASTPPVLDPRQLLDFVGCGSSGDVIFSLEP